MKNILNLIGAGVIVMLLLSNNVQEQSTKPATPKMVLVKDFHNMYHIQTDITKYIQTNVKNGYIVKSVSMSEYEGWQRAVVVLEKY